MSATSGRRLRPDMEQCIEEGKNCHHVCLETVAYCLQQGGRHAEVSHIRALLDCAEICQTTVNLMCRNSDFHERICAVCAEVGERCAQSCDQFGDDAQMKACAEACRRCAASCRRMAA